jgi:hypothetical protein
MVARNLTTLSFGTYNADLGTIQSKNKVELDRYVLGVDGDFDLLDKDWTYSAYYEYGDAVNTKQFWDSLIERYNWGVDAVFAPGTSNIVCRSTLTNPTNGCVALQRVWQRGELACGSELRCRLVVCERAQHTARDCRQDHRHAVRSSSRRSVAGARS